MERLRVRGHIILENRLRNNFTTREQTYRQTDTHTHTDIHKGNNNEIKFAKDITVFEDCFDAIRCFFLLKIGERNKKCNSRALCTQPILHFFMIIQIFILQSSFSL